MSVVRSEQRGRRSVRGSSLRHLFALVAIATLAVSGCAQGRTVVPVRVQSAAFASPSAPGMLDVTSHEDTVRMVATVMVRDLGLPLPETVMVYVYSSRQVFEQGLIDDGQVSRVRAAELSDFAVGVGKRRQLLLHQESNVGRGEWVRLVAHELSHVAQIELAEGEGRAEQWLAEGMAEWVAYRVLERLRLDTVVRRRVVAVETVRDHPAIMSRRLDLETLGTSRGFTVRHLREGSHPTYQLAYLLTDYLIGRDGFDRVVEYFRSFAKRVDRRGNFVAAFGQSLGEFEQEALAHLTTSTH
jgi:hypothetical protein